MKTIFLVLSFIVCLTVVNIEAQLLTAAVIIIGAKILIAKGFAGGAIKGGILRQGISGGFGGGRGGREGGRSSGYGSGYGGRGKREVEDFNNVLLEQNSKDVDDCAKFLVCHLNAKPLNKLAADEFAIASTFGQSDVIDVTLPTVLYDVAAHIGRQAGEKQCRTVYPRCVAEVDNIMKEIRAAASRS